MQRLYGLDALRGIAAAMVVFGHLNLIAGKPVAIGNFGLAVDFFFMLSGYVMARTYEERLRSDLSPMRFLAIRLKRLWPTAAAGTLIGFALYAALDGIGLHSLLALASVLAFVPFLQGDKWMYPYNGVIWSLTTEIVANILHAAVLARLTTRWLGVLMAMFAIAFFANVFTTGQWPVGGWPGSFWPSIARTMMSYIYGIILFRQFRDRPPVRIGFPVLLLAIPVMTIVPVPVPFAWFGMAFVFVVSPILIVAGAGTELAGWQRRWAIASGALSFPLYAVHEPILNILLVAGLRPLAVLAASIAAIGLALWLLAGAWRTGRAQAD